MATEKHADYVRSTRRHSSIPLPSVDLPTRSYPTRRMPGSDGPHNISSYSHIPHTAYNPHEQRRPRNEHSSDKMRNRNETNDENDIRKRKIPNGAEAIATSPAEPTEPYSSSDEGHVSDSDAEGTSKHHNTRATSSTKRARSTDNSFEKSYETSDGRYDSKYGSGKAEYSRDTRAYVSSRSDRDRNGGSEYHSAGGEDRGNYEHYGGDGYDNFRGGWEEHNNQNYDARSGGSGIESSAFCKKKLWVGGLPRDITCEEIRQYFEAYGKLIYVMISPKGNAFVKFSTEEQALFAYRKCYTAYIRDKLVRVKYAIRKATKMPHNKLLYVNNVPSALTRTDLKKEFAKYGEIEDIQMFTVPYLYFFVTFVSEDSAVKARKALKTKYFIQFGKNRVDDKKVESLETTVHAKPIHKVAENSPTKPKRIPSQSIDISECNVSDVLEPLSDSHTMELSDLLNDLQPTNSAIRVLRDWIVDHAANINDILLHVSVMLVAKDNPFTLRLSTLFLIHDLLSYCTQRRVCTEILDTVSALTLPHLQRVINKFHVDSEEESKSVLNILSLWEKYSVFPVSVVEGLQAKFSSGDQADEFW